MKCKKCKEDINLVNSYNVALNEVVIGRLNKIELLKIELLITCPSCDAEMFAFIDTDDIELTE